MSSVSGSKRGGRNDSAIEMLKEPVEGGEVMEVLGDTNGELSATCCVYCRNVMKVNRSMMAIRTSLRGEPCLYGYWSMESMRICATRSFGMAYISELIGGRAMECMPLSSAQ